MLQVLWFLSWGFLHRYHGNGIKMWNFHVFFSIISVFNHENLFIFWHWLMIFGMKVYYNKTVYLINIKSVKWPWPLTSRSKYLIFLHFLLRRTPFFSPLTKSFNIWYTSAAPKYDVSRTTDDDLDLWPSRSNKKSRSNI